MAKWKRRVVTVPGIVLAGLLLTLSTPLWLPLCVLIDAAFRRFRFPLVRLLSFGLAWVWIEIFYIARGGWLWLTMRSGDLEAHYNLMGSWARALMFVLCKTTGIAPTLMGSEALAGGNAIVLARHASLADSLVSGWVLRSKAGLRPRYVLKRELLFDPCLDIVGSRMPNHFLDRTSPASDVELAALVELASGVGPNVVAVIFAEGTRTNDRKRVHALEKIGERDAVRAQRLAGLQLLLPPRPAGSIALLEGAPDADVILAWHTGFDGLDTFGGIITKLSEPLPQARFATRRIARSEVPADDRFVEWLDREWLRMDAEVRAALTGDLTSSS
jgi:1-acyl-sn-glycerol-3-phosphate acyltransferase